MITHDKENTMLINIDYEYGSKIPESDKFFKKTPSIENAYCMFQRIMGAGMSQNRFGPYIFEWLIMKYGIRFVFEIGSNKGGLSLYLANMASVTRHFYFTTIEIDPASYLDNASVEGAGRWLRKLESISEHFKIIIGDAFSRETVSGIKNMMDGHPSLIICDGGNKALEFKTYAPLLTSDDMIIVHDWNVEINMGMIRDDIIENDLEEVPIPDLRTTLALFRKKS